MRVFDPGKSKRRPARVLTPDLVSLVHRQIPEPPDHPDFVLLDDAEYRQMTERLRAGIDRSLGLWIFAYGSLLWNPTFRHQDHRVATVHGWHRSFCLHLTRWRGTPEEPGLMLALDRGGACNGVVFRLPEEEESQDIESLLRREIRYRQGGNRPHWFKARSGGQTIKALGFVANHQAPYYRPEPSLDEMVTMLARACGHIGSCAEYLHRTVESLAEHGIYDAHLWRLQERVAERIRTDTARHAQAG